MSVHPSSFILHPISNPQSLIPNPFVIRTPTATVTDLGTEFGIEVTEHQQSRLHVFQGKVVVQTKTQAPKAPREIEMHARGVGIGGCERRRDALLRTASRRPCHRLCPHDSQANRQDLSLVDVVAGGNGFGKTNGRGIDPAGKTTETQLDLNRAMCSGDGRYHRVAELPLLDGVFIPPAAESRCNSIRRAKLRRLPQHR